MLLCYMLLHATCYMLLWLLLSKIFCSQKYWGPEECGFPQPYQSGGGFAAMEDWGLRTQ